MMKNKFFRALAVFSAVVACVGISGCSTLIKQRMSVDFSGSGKPISASDYLSVDGKVIGPGSYEKKGEIKTSRELRIPMREGKVNPLAVSLGADVDAKLAELGANAMVGTRISLLELDNPSEFAMNMRVMGSGFMIGGGALSAMMLTLLIANSDSDDEIIGAFAGGAVAGLALSGAGLGVRFWADDSIKNGFVKYRLDLEGTAVRR
jgi:hypothetical protein